MKTKILTSILLSACLNLSYGQNVGIGTNLPGSKLTVNGSFAAPYKIVSASAAVGVNDFYTAYNGAADGTLTLPAATAAAPAAGNILGRMYHFKNTGSAMLTIAANGAELLDNQSGSGITSITLSPSQFCLIISKGITGAATTWEVAFLGSSVPVTIAALGASDTYFISGAGLTAFNSSTPQVIPFAVTDVIINQGGSAIWNDAGDYWDIKESGIYEINAFSCFNSGGAPTGSAGYMGINLNVTKNGTINIGGTRNNILDTYGTAGNNPIPVYCIVHLNAGDKISLTMNWGAFDKPSTNVIIATPVSLSENRHFAVKQVSTP
jgi:hypothetical protein